METVQKDTGLQCLALLLRFHQVSVDPEQIAHQFSGALKRATTSANRGGWPK
jgi:subfamily B ATP-binding cassette protein HlyB/CyaB